MHDILITCVPEELASLELDGFHFSRLFRLHLDFSISTTSTDATSLQDLHDCKRDRRTRDLTTDPNPLA